MPIDVSRKTTNVLLPTAVSQQIWTTAQEASIVQQLCPRIQVPAGGLDIPIITGDPEAEWVAETDEKPLSRPTFGTKNLKAYTMAVIVPFSNQFRRDLDTLYNALVQRLPLVLARKFDRTALGFDPSPGSGFDTLAAAPAISLVDDGVYAGFTAALGSVAEVPGGSDIERWVLSAQGEIAALNALDKNDRPLFIDSVTTDGRVDRSILARPVTKHLSSYNDAGDGSDVTVGFGGEWSSAMWGYVEGLSIDVSDQATLNDGGTPLNLWQRNMFAVRVEFEVGFAVRDVNRFVRLTGAAGTVTS